MKNLLRAKGLWEYITGEAESDMKAISMEENPSLEGELSASQKQELRKGKSEAFGRIAMYLSPHVMEIVDQCATPAAAWMTLEKHFNEKKSSTRIRLLTQMMSLKASNQNEAFQVWGEIKALFQQFQEGDFKVDINQLYNAALILSFPPEFESLRRDLQRKDDLSPSEVDAAINEELTYWKYSKPKNRTRHLNQVHFVNEETRESKRRRTSQKTKCPICKKLVFHSKEKCYYNPKGTNYRPNYVRKYPLKESSSTSKSMEAMDQDLNEEEKSNIAREFDYERGWDHVSLNVENDSEPESSLISETELARQNDSFNTKYFGCYSDSNPNIRQNAHCSQNKVQNATYNQSGVQSNNVCESYNIYAKCCYTKLLSTKLNESRTMNGNDKYAFRLQKNVHNVVLNQSGVHSNTLSGSNNIHAEYCYTILLSTKQNDSRAVNGNNNYAYKWKEVMESGQRN